MATKMRVRELSKELGISNKELLHFLREENIPVKSHMSGLTDEQVQYVKEKFKELKQQDRVQKKKVASGIIIRRRPTKKREQERKEEAHEVKKEVKEAEVQKEKEQERHVVEEEVKEKEIESEEKKEVKEHVAEKEDSLKEVEEKVQSPQLEKEQVKEKKEEKKKKKSFKDRRKFRKRRPYPKARVITVPKKEDVQGKEGEASKKEQEFKAPDVPVIPEKRERARRKKKGKKVVDVSNIYEEEAKKKKVDWKKKKEAQVGDKTGGKLPKKKKKEEKPQEPPKITTQPIKAAKRKIKIEEAIRVADLAQQMGVKAQQIIKSLMDLGVMATINQSIDFDTAALVAAEFDYEVEKVGFSEEDFILPKEEDRPEDLKPRPPVVTIMGHVDHGKTTLLDAIRKSDVALREAGGITQHIGAYHVKVGDGYVVFLDTPGHEAFTEMRARGAQVTDIVILIVAADDGVMEQTKEAINHAKAAGVPIIVAINKIDKENADPERVKRELAELGLLPEEWGGDTIYVNISAKKKIGIDQLLEMLLLQAEVLELKANPNKRARGFIIESRLDKGRGPVGTVLIKEGTLKTGDSFVCGLNYGKVRSLINDKGQKVDSAGPSMPVEVQGFDGVPNAGEEFVVVENDKVAKKIAEARRQKHREKELAKQTKLTLESFFKAKEEENIKNLNLIVKTDVQGSFEAINEALGKLSTDEVSVKIIHGAPGAINENDVRLASASNAIIIGFNVRPTAKVKEFAEKEGVEIRFYSVIYDLVNDIKEALSGLLAPIKKEVYLGQAEVKETFNIPKVGTVAGCMVIDGKVQRNAPVRVIRDGVVVYTGKIASLKRFKDDVKEVTKGFECGIGIEKFNDIKVGDIIEAFEEVEEKRTL
ncbi:translation initiation factor IF-2 [Desulfothermus sp.]